jgi:pimeloyl-ACP methyl ester carboxylesterase
MSHEMNQHECLPYRSVGAGPTLLLIHGAAEDADMLIAQAEALAARGRRVVWYDRRGTGSTPRDGWPEGGVAQHADDAAEILRDAGAPADVLGFSSGGVVAMSLAARHPQMVRNVVAWEPAAVGMLEGGRELQAQMMAPVEAHLAEHPGDWPGALTRMLAIISDGHADLASDAVRLQMANAEPAVRDDARHIATHVFTPGEIPADRVQLAHGAGVSPVLKAVITALEAEYALPVRVVDAAQDHEVYLSAPEVLAEAFGAGR